jgi:glycosyltransferase involved in cell wall biosynthesis
VSSGAYCGISSLLTHNVDALILPHPQDANALRQALVRVLGDTCLAHALRQAGGTFAHQHSWQQAAHAYERIYVQIVRP